MPGCKKPAKRSKGNLNEANIESALNMCREGNQYMQVQKPMECRRQHCKISLRCKKREKIGGIWKKNCDWGTKRKAISRLH